jgi:hypothetical protein
VAMLAQSQALAQSQSQSQLGDRKDSVLTPTITSAVPTVPRGFTEGRRQGISVNMTSEDPEVLARRTQQASVDIVSELKMRKAKRMQKKLQGLEQGSRRISGGNGGSRSGPQSEHASDDEDEADDVLL